MDGGDRRSRSQSSEYDSMRFVEVIRFREDQDAELVERARRGPVK